MELGGTILYRHDVVAAVLVEAPPTYTDNPDGSDGLPYWMAKWRSGPVAGCSGTSLRT
jgi:hypothetical protein